MKLIRIGKDLLPEVRKIAEITWPVAFGTILSKEQLAYMMEMMYALPVLERQMEQHHEFYLCEEQGKFTGFMGVEPNYKGLPQLKIHKLYILPDQQGKGLGEQFIHLAAQRAIELGLELLTLNVNRYNKALHFYEKLGFINVLTEDIDIGEGYLMEDYVLEKKLN